MSPTREFDDFSLSTQTTELDRTLGVLMEVEQEPETHIN